MMHTDEDEETTIYVARVEGQHFIRIMPNLNIQEEEAILKESNIIAINSSVREWLVQRKGKLLKLSGYASVFLEGNNDENIELVIGSMFAVTNFEFPLLDEGLLRYLVQYLDPLVTESNKEFPYLNKSIPTKCFLTFRPTTCLDTRIIAMSIDW